VSLGFKGLIHNKAHPITPFNSVPSIFVESLELYGVDKSTKQALCDLLTVGLVCCSGLYIFNGRYDVTGDTRPNWLFGLVSSAADEDRADCIAFHLPRFLVYVFAFLFPKESCGSTAPSFIG